jgi:hypothetical protein
MTTHLIDIGYHYHYRDYLCQVRFVPKTSKGFGANEGIFCLHDHDQPQKKPID